MLTRVISVGIVAFWLVMMTWLVRTELLQSTPHTYPIPMETVMRRMFEGEGSDLTIFYQGDRVGKCSMQIVKDTQSPSPSYLVKSDLQLNFKLFGKPVRLQSWTDSEFDPRYQMTRFHSRTVSADTSMEMQGDIASKEIQFTLNFGDGYQEKHTLPFATLENMGPGGAMGLIGMGGFQTPQSGQSEKGNAMVPSFNPTNHGPTTTVQDTPLTLGKEKISALMVYTRYDDSLWSKVYIDSQGAVLKVETSFGVTMLSGQFSGADKD